MDKAIVELNPDETIYLDESSFNEKDLPNVLQGQIQKLNELGERIKEARKVADAAKKSAQSARKKSAGFGKKKAAIEELQSAGVDLANAVEVGTEAQKVSFEFQKKLAEITRYLFGLGVSNIASNRFVVREIEMRLRGASKEKLSELARQELISVVKQLKQQEDILRKQENISKIVKNHDDRLKVQFEKSQQIDDKLQVQAETNKMYDKQLKIQTEAYKKIEEKLQAHENNNLKTIEAQEIKINMLKDEIDNLKILLDAKGNNTLLKITLAIAIIAFIISVSHFFF